MRFLRWNLKLVNLTQKLLKFNFKKKLKYIHLTNNIIVALDNDDAGRIGTKNTMKNLSNLNTYKFKHYKTLKDTGDLVELEMKGDKELGLIVNSYKSQIRLLTDR